MSTDNNSTGTPKTLRTKSGIVMIIVYIGVGILFLTGFFAPVYGNWEWIRWVGGIIFIVYGVWRAYRQFAGVDSPY